MRQIFKNYLATFIKNWLQTIGTVLFILMMFAVVIGFLAAPLQIYGTVTKMNHNNNHYTQIISEGNYKYNSEFLYKFVYGNDGTYFQSVKDKDGNDHQVEVVKNSGINGDNKQILSDIYKSSLDQMLNKKSDGTLPDISSLKPSTDPNVWDNYASYIRNGIEAFREGALVKTNVGFTLDAANPDSSLIAEYENSINALMINLNNMDADSHSDHAIVSRGVALVNNLFSVNGFQARAQNIIPADGDTSNMNIGQAVVDAMIKELTGTPENPSSSKQREIYLLSSQVFNATQAPVDPKNPGLAEGTFGALSRDNYSYDFLNYLATATINDDQNHIAFDSEKNQYNYNLDIEKSLYLSKTDSSSLFPTLSLELRSVGDPNGINQLQLEKGNRPTAFKYDYNDRQDILKDVVSGKIVPEIVINSGYAKHNHLKIGDMITLPDGPEHNNVTTISPIGDDNYDAFLTSTIKYKIVGIGEKFDDSVPGEHYTPFMQNIDTYANAYVDDGWFNILKEAKWYNSSTANDNYESKIRIANKQGVKLSPVYAFNFNYDDKNDNTGLYDISVTPFVNYKSTRTMQSVNDTKIKVIIFIILGIAVLVLAFIFINFIITKELNETRRQIGIFKSFGYKISELSWIFAIKTFLTIFVGAVLGWVVSIAIQTWSAGNYMASVMFKFHSIYAGAAFMCIIMIVIPLVFLAISYFMTLFYLKEPTLSLLSNGAKVKNNKTHQGPLIKHLAKVGKGFGYRLQQGFVKDSMGKFIVVQILFAVASLTFTLMFGAQGLMYSIADQGFSVLQKEANHRYSWENQDRIGIDYNAEVGKSGPLYSLNAADKNNFAKRDFKYISYSGNEKIGDVLNKDTTMSDSRYRENFLISSISNTFDVDKDKAWEMIMPLDYYLVKYVGVKPADLPTIVYGPQGIIKSSDKNYSFYKNAADADAKIPDAMNSQEMSYHNYFLNWILSFRIGIMNTETKDGITGVDDIKDELIKGKDLTKLFNIDKLAEYVDKWNADPANANNPIKIDMNEIANNAADPNKAEALKTEFNDTLFGLSDAQKDGKKNNLFLSDITKIITLELAESYAEGNFNSFIADDTATNADKDGKKTYSQDDVLDALAKTKADAVWNDFSPNNQKYWGMQDNPLMQAMLNAGSDSKNDSSAGGLSLSKMNGQTISLIMAASMLGINSTDIQQMPTITLNEAFFNKDKEALFENIPVTGVDDSQLGRNSICLFDYTDNKYGTYDTSLTHDGVSDQTYKKLATDTGDKDSVYAVVPYGLAKYQKLKVGDTFNVSTDTKQKRTIKLKVIGINKSVAFSLGGGWSIDVDYNQFAKKFFDGNLQAITKETPFFNSWISNDPMLEGDVNLNDISGSINKMKFVGKNLAMSIQPGSSVFGSIFNGMVDFSTLLGSPIDPNFRLITNPNVASTSAYSSVLPFNILRAGVNNGISEVNNILIVFMVLVAIMLLIILVVVMNIIIEQATPIILTLKSLGYNQKEINWITMGSYITGAVISFIIAYGLSLLIWNVFLIVAGSLWHIYVFMSYTWKAPVITFLVVGAILAFGWFVSDRKVQKIPLTLVTGFN